MRSTSAEETSPISVNCTTCALEHVLVDVVEFSADVSSTNLSGLRSDEQLLDHRARPLDEFVVAHLGDGGAGQYISGCCQSDDECAHQRGPFGGVVRCDRSQCRGDLTGEDLLHRLHGSRA